MKRAGLSLFFAWAVAAMAQQPEEAGARVFRVSCAVGYCHGAGGTAAKAPKLLERKYEAAFVRKVVRDGVPNSGMPAWKERLQPAEIEAVVAYVVELSGGTMSAADKQAATESETAMPPEAVRGKALFSDAARESRCSGCHVAEGIGTPVAPLSAGKVVVRTLHTGDGEVLPAIQLDSKDGWMRVYDLTAPPPVLRSIPEAGSRWSGGSTFQHKQTIAGYTEAEMRDIAAYLRFAGAN